MVQLSTRTFDQMVADQAVAAQAQVPSRGLDFSRGTVFRALAEAFASVGMWLQGLVLRVLAATRAATSRGADLDSWMADFFLTRVRAAFSNGEVTFARFTPTLAALIPVKATVRTRDNTWTFQVVADRSHSAWSEEQQGYVLGAGVATLTVPVVALTPGAGGNAAAGSVTLMSSPIPGVDTVTNAEAMVGGTEAETDEAFRQRFRDYLGSLSKATRPAIDYAVGQVQAGLSWSVLEGQQPDGAPAPATFTLVVDDGTGTPSADLLAKVAAAVEQVRAIGVTYSVIGPVVVTANVTMVLTVTPGVDRPAVVGKVAAALEAHINGLKLGSGLSYTRLTQVAYSASPYVENVTNVALNGGTADIAATPRQAIRAGIVAVS